MVFELKQEVYDGLTNLCLERFRKKEKLTVQKMLEALMDMEGMFMHCPYHHYVIPAALLTIAAIDNGTDEEDYLDQMEMAEERAKTVPGGFCGNCGSCGAAIGIGIFMSVYTGASPMTTKNWQWSNEVTGRCLIEIARFPGPRCCKRTSFLAASAGIPFVNSKCKTKFLLEENYKCKYHDDNPDCIGEACPYYGNKVAILAPESKLPRVPEGINVCDCMSKPVDFTKKEATIHWVTELGRYVAEDQVVCEAEVEKKIIEITSPCEGMLLEQCVEEGDTFHAGDILGFIEPDED